MTGLHHHTSTASIACDSTTSLHSVPEGHRLAPSDGHRCHHHTKACSPVRSLQVISDARRSRDGSFYYQYNETVRLTLTRVCGSLPTSLYMRPRPRFPLGAVLGWALANPSCMPNLKSLASAVAEILKGNPKFGLYMRYAARHGQADMHFNIQILRKSKQNASSSCQQYSMGGKWAWTKFCQHET